MALHFKIIINGWGMCLGTKYVGCHSPFDALSLAIQKVSKQVEVNINIPNRTLHIKNL